MSSKASQRFLLLWSTLAAAGGCQQILGISDYDIDPKLGGNVGGEGGEGGKNTTAGKSGIAGKASAGEPGEGGAGGTPVVIEGGSGGAAGDASAGAGGAGGAPPDAKFKGCDGTPFEGNEAIVRSCILRVGCQPWNYPSDTISRCVSQNAQNTYEGTKCTLDATSCADIAACEGTRKEPTFCGSGASKKKGTYCNGNEVVYCDAFVPYARDCVKEGGSTCHDFGVDLDGAGGATTTVACELPAVTACAGTTLEEACGGPQNGYAYTCQGNIAYGTKCSNYAASCQDLGDGVGCYYPLNNCTSEGVTCANDRATWCDGESKAIFDCGSVGLECQTEGDYTADTNRQCTAPGCTPEDLSTCEESCNGTKLTFCYGGSPITVDCKSYGFTKCESYDYDCDTLGMNDCVYTTDKITFAECE